MAYGNQIKDQVKDKFFFLNLTFYDSELKTLKP